MLINCIKSEFAIELLPCGNLTFCMIYANTHENTKIHINNTYWLKQSWLPAGIAHARSISFVLATVAEGGRFNLGTPNPRPREWLYLISYKWVMDHAIQFIQSKKYSQRVLQLLPVAETLPFITLWWTERLLNLYPGIKRSARRVLA